MTLHLPDKANGEIFIFEGVVQMTTKEKIFEASAHLFARYGYGNVSLRDIAKKVGITAGSIYSHYENKLEILDGILLLYKKNIDTYYPTHEEFEAFADTLSVKEIIEKLFVKFKPEEYDFMMNATAIIIRERFNNSHADKCYSVYFLDKATKRIRDVLDMLIRKKRLLPFDSETQARLWVYAANSVAMESTRMISSISDESTPPPENLYIGLSVDIVNDFAYKILSNYMI